MKLSAADEKKYPKLHYYMKNDLPKVGKIPRISNALKKYGQIQKKDLQTSLKYGTAPVVKVTTLNQACGEFTPNSKSNELRLHKSLVQKFEASKGDKVLRMTIGATILHELVHWGDDQDGKDYPGEEGELFEKHVYKMGQHHCAHHFAELVKKGVVF